MLRLEEIMTTELVSVAPELSVREAMELLVNEHVSGAPVVAQNKVVGVVSVTDLLAFAAAAPDTTEREGPWNELEDGVEAAAEANDPAATWLDEPEVNADIDVAERFGQLESARRYDRLAQHTVADVMTRNICSLPAHTRVDTAADFMRRAAIHRVLVMNDDVLVGIVSLKDIADAVADHKLTERTYVFGKPGPMDYVS